MMYNYKINENGVLCVTDLHFTSRYVEVPRENQFRKLYSYVLIEIDLENAIKYLEEAINTNNQVIREGLFRSAVILYVKCFLPPKNGGRSQLSENLIYKDIPEEPLKCHKKFLELRHKYLAHDEKDFLSSQLGAVLDMDSKKIIGAAYVRKQAKFDYDETISVLYKMCRIALNKTKELLDEETKRIDEYIKERGFSEVNKYPDMVVR